MGFGISFKNPFKSIKKAFNSFTDSIGDGVNFFVGGSKDIARSASRGFAPKIPKLKVPPPPDLSAPTDVTDTGLTPRRRPLPFGGAVATSPLGLVDDPDKKEKRKVLLGG